MPSSPRYGQICDCGEMAWATATRGYCAFVDAADVGLIRECVWYARATHRTAYAFRCVWDAGRRHEVTLHGEIMGSHLPLVVDHINHNGLDNRRANMRLATASDNNSHARKRRGSHSSFKGVYMKKKNGRWGAYITHAGKRRHLGYFATETDAAIARDLAALQLHGQFAVTAALAEGGKP